MEKYSLLLSFKQLDKTTLLYILNENDVMKTYNERYEKHLRFLLKCVVLLHLVRKVQEKEVHKIFEKEREERRKIWIKEEKIRQDKRAIKNKLRQINTNARIKHKEYFRKYIWSELVSKVYHPKRFKFWKDSIDEEFQLVYLVTNEVYRGFEPL